jgi:ribose transport system permease protein
MIWYVFSYTAIGQRLLFVGRGREVARLSGINDDRMRWGCLVVSSLLGAVAGVIYAGTIGAADPNSGLTYLLPAFAAAFLGATSIQPGRFNPIGSVIAVYFLVTGITGLSIIGVSTFVQDLFYGGALIVAVTLSQIVRGREERLS